MTLVFTINGPETLWAMADTRLSYRGGIPEPIDTARKIMLFETVDAVAVLGYAGLGATANKTEPSDWMSAVLRGVNAPFEQAMQYLAQVMSREIPAHLAAVSNVHNVIIPAFVNDELGLFSINIVLHSGGHGCDFRFTRNFINSQARPKPRIPRFALAGTGAQHLHNHKNRWQRDLLKVVRAYERGRVSAELVSDHLATINLEVHNNMPSSVGPNCHVVWRHRKGGPQGGGGSQQYYVKGERARSPTLIPTLAAGHDVNALVGALMPMMNSLVEPAAGQPAKRLTADEFRAAFETSKYVPKDPDETLR